MSRSTTVIPFAEPLWYSRGTNPYYNDSHVRLRDSVRAYVKENITPFCSEWEEQGFVPKEVRPVSKPMIVFNLIKCRFCVNIHGEATQP